VSGRLILLIHCPDREGLAASVTNVIRRSWPRSPRPIPGLGGSSAPAVARGERTGREDHAHLMHQILVYDNRTVVLE